MVKLAQLVRASDCGSEGRGFDPHISPHLQKMSDGFSQYHGSNRHIFCVHTRQGIMNYEL